MNVAPLCAPSANPELRQPLQMPSVLVIDDDPSIALVVRRVLDAEVRLLTATTATEGWEIVARERPDLVLLDVLLPDQTGLEVYQRIRRVDAKLPVIFITSRGASSTAIEAMALGAYDFLTKPLDMQELGERVARALEIRRLTTGPVEVSDPAETAANPSDLLVGRSAAMQQVYKAIGCIASQNVAALLCGETGTGKELAALAIHQFSQRAGRPFLTVACTNSEQSLEVELFGHEKHALVNNQRHRPGKVELCAGGTLVLDEVADLPLGTQSKVLRLLQEQTFEHLGGASSVSADVRILATTSRDLKSLVDAGRFRPDLYYCLSGFTIHLPALRERLDDLPALARHFVTLFNHEFRKRVFRIAPDAIHTLRRYSWPGNVRQLQGVLKQAILRASGAVLLPEFLPADLFVPNECKTAEAAVAAAAAVTDWSSFVAARIAAGSQEIYAESVELMERHVLTLLLQHTSGNQAQAARLLGMTRGSLRTRIRALGISIETLVGIHAMALDEELSDDLGADGLETAEG